MPVKFVLNAPPPSFSYDKSHGWSVGVGAAAEVGDVGFNSSFSFNQDGSKSLDMGASGQYYWLAGGLSYSYNSYTGQTFSGNIGVCVGLKGMVSVGPEIGGSLYVNHEGDIMGATAYAELQASAFGGLASAAVGYESGSMGMEGRGLFAGATVAGIHGELSHLEDGVDGMRGDIGFQAKLFVGIGNNSNDKALDGTTGSMVKWELWMPTLGRFGHFTFGNGYDVSEAGDVNAQDAYLTKELGPGFTADKIDKKGGRTYSKARAEKIDKAMKAKGYLVKIKKPHTFGNPHDGEKHTYYKEGIWGNYGNVELVYEYGKIYASYNYANHWWTHILIDWAGFEWRKW